MMRIPDVHPAAYAAQACAGASAAVSAAWFPHDHRRYEQWLQHRNADGGRF